MLAKMTAKNQVTLPKKVVREFAGARLFEVEARRGRIVLTPVRLQQANAVRAKLDELGLTERDVAEAVRWARKRR
jgi:bifunctional DNA-binding transcriptional regulator/antitoxin component of YhaV-PrlF toxin-antitoxin module